MLVFFGNYPRFANLLITISNAFHKLYEKQIVLLLSIPGVKFLVILYFRFLMYFRLSCMNLGEKYTQNQINMFALVLITIASRLRIAGFFITLSLILAYLEIQFQYMSRFYRKHPTLLATHFPEGQDPKRNMHKVVQAVTESLANPLVKGAIVLTGGALGWKALDVHEINKQEKISEKDRETQAITAQKDQENQAIIAQNDREAEDRRHKDSLAAEAIEREKDRGNQAIIAQNDRRAEDHRHKDSLAAEAVEREKDRQAVRQNFLDEQAAEDRRHKDSLEAKNQVNRETRFDNELSFSSIDKDEKSTSTEDFNNNIPYSDSSLTVD